VLQDWGPGTGMHIDLERADSIQGLPPFVTPETIESVSLHATNPHEVQINVGQC